MTLQSRWELILITKEQCPACDKLAKALKESGLPFATYSADSEEASLLFQRFQLTTGYPIILVLVDGSLHFVSYGCRDGIVMELVRMLR